MAVVDAQVTDSIRLNQLGAAVRAQLAIGRDVLRLREQLGVFNGVVVNDRVRIEELLGANSISTIRLRDVVRFAERLYQSHALGVLEGVGIGHTQQVATAWTLVEKLGIAHALNGVAAYQLRLSDTLRLLESLANFYAVDAVETIGAGDALSAAAQMLAQAQDSIELQAQVQPLLLINVVAEDNVAIDEVDAIQMLFSPTVVEGIVLKAGYLGPDGSFTTWAMNTRTGAVSEYANFAFNSFAKIGRRYLGASENGLYELLGDDDAGDDIIARIRGGFLQFGGTQLSRLKEAYIAARGSQQWVLRIVTGDGDAYNYVITNQSMRSSKVNMGKGQRARYFAYELISSGADFDLDTLEFVPIVVQRRV